MSQQVSRQSHRKALAFALGILAVPATGWAVDTLSGPPAQTSSASSCHPGQYGPDIPCPQQQYRITKGQVKTVGAPIVACAVGFAAADGNPIGCAYGAIGTILTEAWTIW